MSNSLVQKIASVILICGIFVSVFMAAQTARAQSMGGSGIPFGGTIIALVPPIPFVCATPHTLIFDFSKLRLLGLVPSANSKIYMNFNIATPGTFVLGAHTLLGITACALPYPIHFIDMIGTS